MSRVGWLVHRVMLVLVVAMAVGWLPRPWNAVGALAVFFILGVTRPYQRWLSDHVKALPPVRAAVTWLCVPPEKKEVPRD